MQPLGDFGHRCQYYFNQVLTSPFHTLLKMYWKIKRKLKRHFGLLQVKLVGENISDDSFLRALNAQFSTISAFLIHTKDCRGPRSFPASSPRYELVDAIRTCYPEAEHIIVSAADQVCNHTFDLLGSGSTYLGDKIDWHVDFKTEYHFDPRQYYADVRPAPYPGGYDIKVPWELNRCQHFVWLGQAYWFTKDEKYAREFVTQVEDWIVSNPWPWGVNWACTMDVAIRAVNWLWGYHFFSDSPSLSDGFNLAFYKSLLVHGRHIWRNPENWGEFTGNHYLSDLVGLVYLGILCPEFKESQRWREFGLRELEQEMFKQVYPDGVNFEASTAYHRLETELFLSATILAQRAGYNFSSEYMKRLEKMVEFVLYLTKPDGTAPLIGDNDNGRLHRLKVWNPPEREWVDYRYLLAIGAALFRREDFAQAAGDQWEEALWLSGEDALTFRRDVAGKNLPPLQLASQSFPDAGWYFLRHNAGYMSITAGPNGQNDAGGHAHNDKLSFELFVNEQVWFVDPGTDVYTADYGSRNQFRSTAFHNTIQIDAQEQNDIIHTNLFKIQPNSKIRLYRWRTTALYDVLDVGHTGYMRLAGEIEHRRQIFFNKGTSPYWVIRDILTGTGCHDFEFSLHTGNDVIIHHSDSLTYLSSKFNSRGVLAVIPLIEEELRIETQDTWIAPGYGKKVQSKTVCYRKSAPAPAEFITVFYPILSDETFAHAIDHAHFNALSAWEEAKKSFSE